MTRQPLKSAARVHRFRDLVAVSVGDGSTAYLTPKAARQLARALNACVRSIKADRFVDSAFGTVTIHDGDDLQASGRKYEYQEPRQ
jgi:hypothetical protein